MDNFEKSLRGALFRRTCPEGLSLVDYYDGRLDLEHAVQITGHLAICDHCQLELNRLNAARLAAHRAAAAEPAPSLAERMRVMIAQLLPPAGSERLGQPAAALRGRGARAYQVEGWRLLLDIQPDRTRPELRTIMGRLSPPEEGEATPHTAGLARPDGALMTTPIDVDGAFALHEVTPAVYRLMLHGEAVEIHLPRLDLTQG